MRDIKKDCPKGAMDLRNKKMQVIPSFQVHAGQLLGARQIPSPNFNARPADTEIQLIVIHNISLPPSQFGGGYIEQFFQNQLD